MEQRDGGYTSVRRALQLLRAFTREHNERSVGELAHETGLHKSVVTRLMATMARAGFVAQNPESRKYQIGPVLFSVGNVYRAHMTFSQIGYPILKELAARCSQSCAIAIPSGREAQFVVAVDAPPTNAIRVTMSVGSRRSLHIGSAGKMILAGMSDGDVRTLFGDGPLEKMTPYTIGSMDRLLAELAEIRRRGFATNREESLLGSGGVAAPILDKDGATVATIVINFYVHQISDAEMQNLGHLVIETANQISRALGSNV